MTSLINPGPYIDPYLSVSRLVQDEDEFSWFHFFGSEVDVGRSGLM